MTGTSTATTARCHWTPETHTGCGWTHPGPDPNAADRAADRHTRTTGHGTTTHTRPTDTQETP